MSCGVGHRRSSDPVLPWLWCRPTAEGPIRPLAWEPPYAVGDVTYGSSQARHQIITAAASLHHSHNNAGSKPCLWPPPQFIATPLSKARDQIHVLLDTWVHYYWATTGIPSATISLNKLSALFSHSSFGAPLIRKVVIWMIFHRSHRLSSFFFLHSSLTA